MLTATYNPTPLPPSVQLETVPVLKALNRASRALADLKGQARTIPNQGILIDTLALQEANLCGKHPIFKRMAQRIQDVRVTFHQAILAQKLVHSR